MSNGGGRGIGRGGPQEGEMKYKVRSSRASVEGRGVLRPVQGCLTDVRVKGGLMIPATSTVAFQIPL